MKRRCGEGRAQSAQEIPTRDQRHFRESAFKPRRRPMRMVRRLSLVVVTVVLLASLPVAAQQPVAPPPPQIPYGTPISLEQAKKAVAAAEAESRKNHWNMVIAVLDTSCTPSMRSSMTKWPPGCSTATETVPSAAPTSPPAATDFHEPRPKCS